VDRDHDALGMLTVVVLTFICCSMAMSCSQGSCACFRGMSVRASLRCQRRCRPVSGWLSSQLILASTITVTAAAGLLYHSYLSVRQTALYKRTSLDRLSLGQKATVLIKIYLAEGDKPIIIDSHDDHLDNEFLMEELVGSIRQARNFRQVIIASNNGNVVINSDADQVIVAQRKDGEISYISGAIEDPAIRERALKVLEGGYEAFKRRQQKYRISRPS
jgi:hypothetical protein